MNKFLPEEDKEVLVQLVSGNFAVAAFDGADWYTGAGVYESHENERYTLSAKVASWTELPKTLNNDAILTEAEQDYLNVKKNNQDLEEIKSIKFKR